MFVGTCSWCLKWVVCTGNIPLLNKKAPEMNTVRPVNLWKKGVNLELIGTKGFSAVSYRERCALSHTRSPAKSNGGKVHVKITEYAL